jgi:hypothetical protein
MPTKTKLAQPTDEQFSAFTTSLSDEFLYCRRYGHNWTPRTAIKRKWWYEATVVCARCTAERIEVINMRGEIVKKYMRYPQGYLAINIGRIMGESKNKLRLVALGRHLSGTEIEEEETGG